MPVHSNRGPSAIPCVKGNLSLTAPETRRKGFVEQVRQKSGVKSMRELQMVRARTAELTVNQLDKPSVHINDQPLSTGALHYYDCHQLNGNHQSIKRS